jgi:DNA excision repair protein ERCC-2
MIRLKRFFDRSYKDIILIIDEAHNLPFRAMEYYSPSLSMDEITETEEHLKSLALPESIISKGNKILHTLSRYYHSVLNSNQSQSNIQHPKKTLISIDRDVFSKVFKEMELFLLQYIVSFTKSTGAFPTLKDKLLVFAYNLKQFYGILTESDSAEFSQIADYSENNLKILCKSAAEKLKKQINGFHSVIAQSATFFPTEYFRRMLGFPKNASIIEFDSPFPKENHLYMSYPHISTKYQDRSGSYNEIADILFKAVSIKHGNYLAFFPSFTYLTAVLTEIKKLSLPIKLLVQERKMTEKKRKLYLNKLKKGESPYLLMGVLGGIFSEGIDFLGDMAIGAFIIGPGLPAYCFEQELKKKYFNQKWNKGFEYAYRNIGMMKVIQAAGRVFRSPTDRGIVVLIGQRFINKYYRSVLPQNWDIENPHKYPQRIESFWNQHLSLDYHTYDENLNKKIVFTK